MIKSVGGGTGPVWSADPFMALKANELAVMPLLAVGEDALRSLVDEKVKKVGGESLNFGKEGVQRPLLAPPKESAAAGGKSAGVLFASVLAVFEKATLDRQASNAYSRSMADAVRRTGMEELLVDLEAALKVAVESVDVNVLTVSLAGMTADVKLFRLALSFRVKELAKLDATSPEYAQCVKDCDKLRQQLAICDGKRTQIEAKLAAAKQNLENLSALSLKALNSLQTQDAQGKNHPLAGFAGGSLGQMLKDMAELGELGLEMGEVRAKAQSALTKIQEVRVDQMKKDAEKADREAAKAEALNKAMGCVGKILGGLVMAVALVGAVFTGGASLVLAGVGIALMLGDQICKAATGTSFMDEAFKPLMKLLQPVMQFVLDKVSSVLESAGVDTQTAKMISMIAVSVVIALAVVALAVSGAGGAVANAASKVASYVGKAMARVFEKSVGKLVSEVLKKSITRAAGQMSKSVSKMVDAASERVGLSTDAVAKRVYAERAGYAGAALSAGDTITHGGMDVGVEVVNVEFGKLTASLKLSAADLNVLRDMFSHLADLLGESVRQADDIFTKLSGAINEYASASQTMAHSLRV